MDKKRGLSGDETHDPAIVGGDASKSGSAPENGARDGAADKRKKRRWPIAVGIVAVVVVCAGAGFWVWHEQPSFCNAVCHEPMDNYVEGYYQDDTLMAHAHMQEGVTCLQCHEAKIDQQVAEARSWATKSYRVDENGNLATVNVTADKGDCATSGCHNWSDVVAATENWGGEPGVNPHLSHQGEAIDCSNCHSAHGASNMYCNTCHDYKVPEGWTSQS